MSFSWDSVLEDIEKEPSISASDFDFFYSEINLLTHKKNEFTFFVDPLLKTILSDKTKKYYLILEKHLKHHSGSSSVKIKFTSSSKKQSTLVETLIKAPEGLNSSLTFENFLWTDSTKDLVKKAKYLSSAYSAKSFGFPIFIYGSPGSGKTHLINAIGNSLFAFDDTKKILYVQASELSDDVVRGREDLVGLLDTRYYTKDVLIIDDFQNLENKEGSLDCFFKIFEKFKKENKMLIITSDKHPSSLNINERYFSRLQEGLSIDMPVPDVYLKKLVLIDLLQRNEFTIEDSVALFMAKNSANLRELTGYVNNIISEFIMLGSDDFDEGSIVTMSMALKTVRINDSRNVSLDRIAEEVANYFGSSVSLIKQKNRSPEFVYRRRLAVFLADRLSSSKKKEIATYFNYKDHSAVVQILKTSSKLFSTSQEFRKDVEQVEINIKSPKK